MLCSSHAPAVSSRCPARRSIDAASTTGANQYSTSASIVASGTATVEAALIGNPFVVVYRVSPMSYAIAKRVVDVPHVAMANLIAGRRMVPELIQHDFTAEAIVSQLEPLLHDEQLRQTMQTQMADVRRALTPPAGGAIQRVAQTAAELMQASMSSLS